MKTYILFFLLAIALIFIQSCTGVEGSGTEKSALSYIDTIPPVITLDGQKVDTTYLQISSTTLIARGASSYTWLPGNSSQYMDPGAGIIDMRNGELRCVDISVEVTGTVNNKSPGTYYLYYNATDEAGNKAATVTRTVHVLESKTAFLNGNYQVAYTCTRIAAGSQNATITADTYTANISPSTGKDCRFEMIPGKDYFELTSLRIGPEYVKPFTSVCGQSLHIGYFSPDYASSSASGTLSATKNTFTIETVVYPYAPKMTYICKNVYTKIKGS